MCNTLFQKFQITFGQYQLKARRIGFKTERPREWLYSLEDYLRLHKFTTEWRVVGHQDAIEQVVAPIFSPNFKKMCTVEVHITTENIFFTGYDHKEFVRRHLLAMKSIVKNTTQPPTSNTPTISFSVHSPATIIPACSHPLVQSPPTITTTNSSLVVPPSTMITSICSLEQSLTTMTTNNSSTALSPPTIIPTSPLVQLPPSNTTTNNPSEQ